MNDKIGIGVLCTHNNFDKTISSINTSHDIYVVSCSYMDISDKHNIKDSYVYTQDTPKTWAKNRLIRMMLNDDCDHLFIIEDSVIIKNNNIFEKYIQAAKNSGIWCFLHSNKEYQNDISYEDIKIGFSDELQNHLMYIFRGVIKNIGFFDERYDKGILETHDYVKRILDKGLLPGWCWFPDLYDSKEYIDTIEIEEPIGQDWWYENIWFGHKHKERSDDIKKLNDNKVLNNLNFIKENYSK